ncbi:AAA family ATPase [Lactovum odontotermitis]
MMIQKIREITIENVKNVEYGKISFTEKNEYLNVTGIYGQNGSGKTTLIDVLEILKNLLLGNGIGTEVAGMLETGTVARIVIKTEVINERVNTYELRLKKEDDNKPLVTVISENLYTKPLEKGKKEKNILQFDRSSQAIVKSTKKEAVASLEALNIINDITAQRRTSYLFDPNFQKLVKSNKNLEEALLVLEQFKTLAGNIRMYTSEYSGLISANIVTPVGVHYRDKAMAVDGVIPFYMQNGGFVQKQAVGIYQNVIRQMNILLPEIIPGLKLDIFEREARIGQNGADEVRLEFFVTRGGKRFSLVYESDGIKKIIGLLSFLVEAYNDPNIIAAIDEFDSGIFEYLLGELVDVMATGAKGQLIFTSHNLRVLEVLPTNCVVFSTTNPENRYIRMKGVKRTNNLRDFYLRAIQLGGQSEELYVGQTTSKIRMALIKAKAGAKLD